MTVVIRCSVVLRTVAVPVVTFLKMPCSSDDSEKLMETWCVGKRFTAEHLSNPSPESIEAGASCLTMRNIFDKLRPKIFIVCPTIIAL